MEKLISIIIFSLILILFFWKYILDGILYVFVPKRYSLEGKIIDLWEEPSSTVFIPMVMTKLESGEALVQMKKVTLYSYFISIKIAGEEEETTLRVNSDYFDKLIYLNNSESDFCILTCKKYAWCNIVDIVNIS